MYDKTIKYLIQTLFSLKCYIIQIDNIIIDTLLTIVDAFYSLRTSKKHII